MKEPKNHPRRVPSEADLRRIAADREARIRLDEMCRRDEIEEVRAQAYAEGFALGLAQARAETAARERADIRPALRTLLQGILELRFGSIDAAHIAAVQAASTEQIGRWVERIDDAESVDELLAH